MNGFVFYFYHAKLIALYNTEAICRRVKVQSRMFYTNSYNNLYLQGMSYLNLPYLNEYFSLFA